jgi:hypothetical protein
MLLKVLTLVVLSTGFVSPAIAERGSGRIETAPKVRSCPIGEGCTIVIPNPPRSGDRAKQGIRRKQLIAKFVPDRTDPPKGNPEGTGTR